MNSWDELALFEIRDLAEAQYQEKHGGSLNAGKFAEIQTNLQQGRSYFLSASSSSELVKPVLIYYGVLSLSRAALLFLNPALTESSLKPGHGISTVGWQNLLSGSNHNYEKLPVKFCAGTFLEFLKGGGNTEHFEFESNSFERKRMRASNSGDSNIESNCTLMFEDVLSRIPDLECIYRRIYGTESLTFTVLVKASSLTVIDNGEMVGYTNVRDLTDRGVRGLKDEITTRSVSLNTSYKEGENGTDLPFISKAWTGCQVTLPFACGDRFVNISYIGKLYLASYMMGMLARYFPTSWMRLLKKDRGSKIYPVIQSALRVVETKYAEKLVSLMTSRSSITGN